MIGLPDASAWALDPDLAYLNHGGFGAAPTRVLAEQQAWREAMERNPAGFLTRELPGRLDAVRDRVARFLGADPDGLVFTDNATTGTQTVIAQARLAPGDEVLRAQGGGRAVRRRPGRSGRGGELSGHGRFFVPGDKNFP